MGFVKRHFSCTLLVDIIENQISYKIMVLSCWIENLFLKIQN